MLGDRLGYLFDLPEYDEGPTNGEEHSTSDNLCPNARPVETGWSPTINGRALNERLTTCPANIHTTRIMRLFGLGAPTFPLFFFTPRLSQPPFFSTASNRNRRRHSAQLKWPSITITLEYGKSSLLLESARLIRLTHRPCSHPLFGQITTPIGSTAM